MMIQSEPEKRILVYIGRHRDDAIGENLIKLPFLRAIYSAYPNAQITWVHGHDGLKFQTMLEPLARGMIHEALPATVLGNSWTAALNPCGLLAGRHFDLIIDTQKNPRDTLALRRISHDMFISSCWRFVFSSKRPPGGKLAAGTLSERLLQLLELAVGRKQNPDYKAIIPDDYRDAANRILSSQTSYIGLAPGAGRIDTGKCWPLENFILVAKHQLEKSRTPVFILGPEEADWQRDIKAEIPNARFSPLEFKTADGTSLDGPTLTIALAGKLSLGLANCSGTGHMLAAGGAPMVSLFGPTNPDKFAPYTPDITIIKAQDFGTSEIADIPVSKVIDAMEKRLVHKSFTR